MMVLRAAAWVALILLALAACRYAARRSSLLATFLAVGIGARAIAGVALVLVIGVLWFDWICGVDEAFFERWLVIPMGAVRCSCLQWPYTSCSWT